MLNRAIAASFARVFAAQDLVAQGHVPAGTCFWCGQPATSDDHLFLLTQEGRWSRKPEVIIPSCSECNWRSSGRRDPELWIEENPRIQDKRAAKQKLRKITKLAQRYARDLPQQAIAEMDALYLDYERSWDRLKRLDAKVEKWVLRWKS